MSFIISEEGKTIQMATVMISWPDMQPLNYSSTAQNHWRAGWFVVRRAEQRIKFIQLFFISEMHVMPLIECLVA